MHNRGWWYRLGNYYEFKGAAKNSTLVTFHYKADSTNNSIVEHQVHFRTLAEKACIRMMFVTYTLKKEIYLQLHATMFNQDEINTAILKFFSQREYRRFNDIHSNVFDIKLDCKKSLVELNNLFQYLNSKYEYTLFPTEISDEISQIYNFSQESRLNKIKLLSNKESKYQHHITEFKLPYSSHVNPDRYHSHELTNILGPRGTHRYTKTLLKKLLVSGENPNQFDHDNYPPLYYALIHDDIDVMKLLMAYGADPLNLVNGVFFANAFELTKKMNKPAKYQLLLASVTRPSKPFHENTRAVVESINSFRRNDKIMTVIQMSDKARLISELKPMRLLTDAERNSLFPIYKIHCKAERNIEESFNHTYKPGKGKLIDLIRDKDGKVIGALTIILRKDQNERIVLLDLMILDPAHCNTGLLALFLFRLPCAMQNLYPNDRVTILMDLASYAAMSIIEEGIFEPKFQPDGMKKRMKKYEKIFGNPLVWTYAPDGVFFTVKEKYHITVERRAKPDQTLLEEFFYTHLLSDSDGYVRIRMEPGDDLLKVVQNALAPRKVNFHEHYLALQQCIKPSCNNDLIFDSSYSFWKGEPKVKHSSTDPKPSCMRANL